MSPAATILVVSATEGSGDKKRKWKGPFSDSGGGFSFPGIRRWELRPVTLRKGEIATRRGSKERQLRPTVTCSSAFRPRETPPEGAQTQTWGAASRRPVCGSEEPTQVSVLGPTPPRGALTLGVSRPAPPVAFFHALPTTTPPPPSDPIPELWLWSGGKRPPTWPSPLTFGRSGPRSPGSAGPQRGQRWRVRENCSAQEAGPRGPAQGNPRPQSSAPRDPTGCGPALVARPEP